VEQPTDSYIANLLSKS